MRMVVAVSETRAGRPLVALLEEAGHDVVRVSTAAAVLSALAGRGADAVILAARLPPDELAAVCRALRAGPYAGPIVIVEDAPPGGA